MMRRPRILIVDDEPGVVRLLALMLTKRYEVLVEVDATQVLEATVKFKPHLVLLDLVMPKIPGQEVAQQIRGDSRVCDTPILILSAIVLKRDARTEVAGCPAIAKPIRVSELVVAIEEQLEKRADFDALTLQDRSTPTFHFDAARSDPHCGG